MRQVLNERVTEIQILPPSVDVNIKFICMKIITYIRISIFLIGYSHVLIYGVNINISRTFSLFFRKLFRSLSTKRLSELARARK